jgi:hypothetical protein
LDANSAVVLKGCSRNAALEADRAVERADVAVLDPNATAGDRFDANVEAGDSSLDNSMPKRSATTERLEAKSAELLAHRPTLLLHPEALLPHVEALDAKWAVGQRG